MMKYIATVAVIATFFLTGCFSAPPYSADGGLVSRLPEAPVYIFLNNRSGFVFSDLIDGLFDDPQLARQIKSLMRSKVDRAVMAIDPATKRFTVAMAIKYTRGGLSYGFNRSPLIRAIDGEEGHFVMPGYRLYAEDGLLLLTNDRLGNEMRPAPDHLIIEEHNAVDPMTLYMDISLDQLLPLPPQNALVRARLSSLGGDRFLLSSELATEDGIQARLITGALRIFIAPMLAQSDDPFLREQLREYTLYNEENAVYLEIGLNSDALGAVIGGLFSVEGS